MLSVARSGGGGKPQTASENVFFKFIRLVFYAPHLHVSQKAGRESKEAAAFVKLIVAPGDGGEAIVVSWI